MKLPNRWLSMSLEVRGKINYESRKESKNMGLVENSYGVNIEKKRDLQILGGQKNKRDLAK